MKNSFTIIYITGKGHSGSTLLDLLISTHSEVTSAGEMKVISSKRKRSGLKRFEEKKCTCGVPKISDCTFWRHIDAKMIESDGLSLWDVDLCNNDLEIFKAHNLAVFSALSAYTGCRFIVDSSKNIDRLEKLLKAKVFDILPIHLIRNPCGVVFSDMEKGRDLIDIASGYNYNIIRTRHTLVGIDHYSVHYETLAGKPSHTLSEIMLWLGLSLEDGQLDWHEHEHHNIAGNRMRFSQSSEIKLDDSWKKYFTLKQRIGINYMTLPTRLPGTWLYELYPPIWDVRELRKNMLRLVKKFSGLFKTTFIS